MAVNTTNSGGLSLLNLYKLNLAANKDVVQDLSPAPEEADENEAYQVRISEQALQLAQEAKIRNGYDMTPTEQETDPALNRSRFAINTQNRTETTQLAAQNRSAARYGIEVVA
jgi:hypothetical protein